MLRRQSKLHVGLFFSGQPSLLSNCKTNGRTEEEERALGVVGLLGVVEFGARGTVELDLPCESARPDDDGDDGDKCQTEEAARAPSEACAVKDAKADHQRSNDGASTLQRPIQCA